MLIHYVPHRLPPYPEGHATRAAVLRDELGATTIAPGELMPRADPLLVDTYPLGRSGELAQVLPRIKRKVLLARALNEPAEGYPYDLSVVPGPYEGTAGEIIDPLVPIAPAAARDIPVLVVGRARGAGAWAARADELVDAGFDVTLLNAVPWRTRAAWVQGEGAPFMARAHVVVGAGGAGSLYGSLWAGCPYVVARVLNLEQQMRMMLAADAGEPIIDGQADLAAAVGQALAIEPRDPRPNGVAALRELIA